MAKKHLRLRPNQLEFYSKIRDGNIDYKNVEVGHKLIFDLLNNKHFLQLISMFDTEEVVLDGEKDDKRNDIIAIYLKNRDKIFIMTSISVCCVNNLKSLV